MRNMRHLIKLIYRPIFLLKYTILVLCVVLICLMLNYYDPSNWQTTLLSPFLDRENTYLRTKNVLIWTFNDLFYNRSGIIFPLLNCHVSDCVFTQDRNYINGDYSKFDAVLFKEDILTEKKDRPRRRNSSQIYVFTTAESSYNHPACELFNDNFFNWTFTFKLDSDLVWNYFVVRNVTGHVVAPDHDVNWTTKVSPISPTIKVILRNKTKAAAWLVSHCNAESLRDEYLMKLQGYLFHYSLQIDVYGGCSERRCADDDCEEMLARDYHFYMAFENSFSVDYVTEKVLHGYNNYVVPIVYGGANYSRFLPPGSYVNALEIHPHNLAHLIHKAMNSYIFYQEFFTWTNHYVIDNYPPGQHPLCRFCEAMHSSWAGDAPAHEDFRLWWNGLDGMSRCLPREHWTESLFSGREDMLYS